MISLKVLSLAIEYQFLFHMVTVDINVFFQVGPSHKHSYSVLETQAKLQVSPNIQNPSNSIHHHVLLRLHIYI